MERRPVGKELLDLPGEASRDEIEGNLRDISRANRWLGGTSVVLCHLIHLIDVKPYRRPVRILDLATGLADIPVTLVRWARAHRLPVEIIAVDRNPIVVDLARENVRPYPEIHVRERNILSLPFADGEFDFVTASQVIHHLENEDVVSLLKTANRLASGGIVVSDIRRRPLCTLLANIGTLVVENRLSRHDGIISFRNAFTPGEIEELAVEAGLPCWRVYTHGPCRLALVSDKRTTECLKNPRPINQPT